MVCCEDAFSVSTEEFEVVVVGCDAVPVGKNSVKIGGSNGTNVPACAFTSSSLVA